MRQKRNSVANIFFEVRWLCLSCLIFLINGCIQSSANNNSSASTIEIQKIKTEVKSGDVITRTGNDFTSQTLRQLNRRNKKYSHIGIAVIENDSVFVYHALGGDFNPSQIILREPFELFVDKKYNFAFGIFRYSVESKKLGGAISACKNFYNAKIPFDMDFNIATNDKMYCAEFVAKSFLQGDKTLNFNKSEIAGKVFYGIDDIFLNPAFKAIKELTY